MRSSSLSPRTLPFFLILFGTTCLQAAVTREGATAPSVSPVLLWLALALGWMGSILFIILDSALFTLDSDQIDNLEKLRPRSGQILKSLREDLDRTWFTLLSGSLFFNLVFAFAAAALLTHFTGAAGIIRSVLFPLAAIAIVFLFGEAIPGLLAARWLEALAPASARCVRIASLLLMPLYIFPLLLLRVLARFSRLDTEQRHRALEAEKRLLVLVGAGQVDVSLEEEEREMIDHAFEFGERAAGDVMTPRAEIAAVDNETPHEDVLQFLRGTTFSRVLVYHKSLDNVEGILQSKQALLNPSIDYRQILTPPLFVPEDMALVDLIALMKSERRQIVVVLDEYGGTAGVVTMNDLLAELVGRRENRDEDSPERKAS